VPQLVWSLFRSIHAAQCDVMIVDTFDLIVIGGGPAGASGAVEAARLGKRVALIERLEHLGGAGVNTGTIPSKTLREAALTLSGVRSRRSMGVDLSVRPEEMLQALSWRAMDVARNERQALQGRLERQGVHVLHGVASFIDSHTIRIAGTDSVQELAAEKFLIATGSCPVRPPEFTFEHEHVCDSDEVLKLGFVPEKVVIVGAGVIGCEYACTFASLGTEVHVIDGRKALLPFLDEDIADALTEDMVRQGVQFYWNERVVSSRSLPGSPPTVVLSSGKEITADALLVCSGRQSNTADLMLAAAGVTLGQRGLIEVNAAYQSSAAHIYAVGDVIGAPALASTGIEQGRLAAAHAFGAPFAENLPKMLPTGIYSIPEASMVGETEAALRQNGVATIVGRAYYADLPRGGIMGDRTGFLKLVFRQSDMRLLGVHIIGEQATELAHIGLVAMHAEAGVDLLTTVCFNFPTLGDLYKFAALDALAQRASENAT
jgi:NAD(P) transhydrogenase